MMKVGKSEGEGTFADRAINDGTRLARKHTVPESVTKFF